jgi:hypothetical protein
MRWQVIAQLVTEHGWTHGVEIGTADGRCTDFVLSACPKLHMSTVDLWEPQPGVVGPEDWSNWPHAEHERKARTRLTRFGPRCRILKMCSRRAAALMPDRFFNCVFLDGEHVGTLVAGGFPDEVVGVTTRKIQGQIYGHEVRRRLAGF